MLKYLLIAAAAICFWVFWARQKTEDAQKKVEAEALRATQNLQSNVKRAEDAADKANEIIKRQEESLKRGIAHAEGQ